MRATIGSAVPRKNNAVTGSLRCFLHGLTGGHRPVFLFPYSRMYFRMKSTVRMYMSGLIFSVLPARALMMT